MVPRFASRHSLWWRWEQRSDLPIHDVPNRLPRIRERTAHDFGKTRRAEGQPGRRDVPRTRSPQLKR